MELRSSDRKLSFDILSNISSFDEEDDDDDSLRLFRSHSDPIPNLNDHPATQSSFPQKHRRRNKHKKKKQASTPLDTIPEDPALVSNSNDGRGGGTDFESRTDFNCQSYVSGGGGGESGSGETVYTVVGGVESGYNCGELRQRNVNGSEVVVDEESSTEKPQWRNEALPNGNSVVTKLETAESLDWKRVIAEAEAIECEFINTLCSYFRKNDWLGIERILYRSSGF